jgi:indolepyruvate ferredoxin oxidoreductase
MMLGYAWQSGLVPLAAPVDPGSHSLNGVAVGANSRCLQLGPPFWRMTPPIVTARAHPPAGAGTADPRCALVDARAAHLRAWQNEALATRYRAALDRLAAPTKPCCRTVAEAYAKVLAPKDEYEVARLYSLPAFRAGLEAEFAGNYRLSLNLAPPSCPAPPPMAARKNAASGPGSSPPSACLPA